MNGTIRLVSRHCMTCGQLYQGVHLCSQKFTRVRSRGTERQSRELRTAWVARHGWICPGWKRAPHPSRDLTLDHVIPVVEGGQFSGPVRVLCRSCNSARQAPPPDDFAEEGGGSTTSSRLAGANPAPTPRPSMNLAVTGVTK